MWGGGFLKQASETSKYNHDLLRKTKDKKVNSPTKRIVEASGKLKSGGLTEIERANLIEETRKSESADFRVKLFVILMCVLAALAWVFLR